MRIVDIIVAVLILIGALNWGLVGLFDFDLVSFIFSGLYLDRVIYIIVGAAGVYRLVSIFRTKKIY